jgi:hypothetical protein
LAESFDGISKPLLELFSLEKEETALLPGGLFVLLPAIPHIFHAQAHCDFRFVRDSTELFASLHVSSVERFVG